MKNEQMTVKERNLVKGAIRRVFSRSELRRRVLEACKIPNYCDSSRPRVSKWGKCAYCAEPTPLYLMEVDHIDPVVPLDKTLEDLSWDTVIDRIWCKENGLQVLCPACHTDKTKAERLERKKGKQNGKSAKRKAS